jgi:hypothetical protein
MKPIPFPEANTLMVAPPGMADCGSMPVHVDEHSVISKWQLSDEDVEQLIENRCLWLSVFMKGTPPIAMSFDKTIFVSTEGYGALDIADTDELEESE